MDRFGRHNRTTALALIAMFAWPWGLTFVTLEGPTASRDEGPSARWSAASEKARVVRGPSSGSSDVQAWIVADDEDEEEGEGSGSPLRSLAPLWVPVALWSCSFHPVSMPSPPSPAASPGLLKPRCDRLRC